MSHTSWLLALIILLSCCDWTWAAFGSRTRVPERGCAEPDPCRNAPRWGGRTHRIFAARHFTLPAADSWRYRFYEDVGGIIALHSAGPIGMARRGVLWPRHRCLHFLPCKGSAAFVPNSPGVVHRRVPPPYRWLPRREGESDGRYMGRLARWNSPYANGFVQFSGPPAAYYGYGFGYGSMNPYAG